jgi:NitT/TauT family transport system substrate-binding protein
MIYSPNRRELLGAAAGLTAVLAAPAVVAQSSNKLNLLVTTSPPDPNAHYFWWAAENGFYRDANLDVTIKSIVADTTTVRALIAGEGDIGWAGSGSGMLAMAAGSRLKILSSFDPRLDFSVVASKDVPDLKGLVGRPFAISQIGATSHVVSQLMVERAVGGRAEVQWLSVGSGSARLQALNAKRVDATILNSLQAVAALKNANLHKLGDGLSQLPQFLYSWEIVTEAALKAKPDQLKAFVAATSRGVAWGMANPADAAKISQKLLPDIAPDDLLEVIKTYSADKYFDISGALRRADWDYTVEALMKTGGLGKSLKFDEFVEKGITSL